MNKKLISMIGVVLLIICSSAVCLSFGIETLSFNNMQGTNIKNETLEKIEERASNLNNSEAFRFNFNNIIKANETATYTVKHYKMKTDGETYADPEVETKEGLAGTLVSPETKEYKGFTSPKVQTVKVEADGSTVVEYRYERNKYKLELIASTGITDVIGTGEFYYGQIVPISAEVAEGYSFRNWIDSNNKACTDSEIKIKISDRDMSFTANAKPNKGIPYIVKHYKMNVDGKTYSDPFIEYKTGKTDEMVTPEVKIYKGFTSPETKTAKVNLDGSTVIEYYYTRNKYKLELLANTGIEEVKGTGEYYYEQEVEISAKPAEGFDFDKWVYDIGRTCEDATVKVKIGTRNVMMVANAKAKEEVSYTVKHYKMNLDGKTFETPEVETKKGTANKEVTPEVKQYEGFTSPELKTVTISPNGNTVVEYYYTRNKYKLELKANEGISEVKGAGEYYYETEVEISAKVKEGYIFDCWKDANGGNSKNINAKVKIGAKDAVIEANAVIDKSITYKITYDANGGTAVAEQTVSFGDKIIKPKDPTRNGYKFVGWYVNLTDKEAFDFDKATATQNITLHAKWEANKYTVKFNANGGQGTMADQQFTYDQEGTLNANSYVREGYTFAGWSETADGTVKYVNGAKVKNLAESGNKILYAVWTPIQKYTITYDSKGGTAVDKKEVISGAKATMPTAPTRKGYTFKAWYIDAEYKTAFDFNTAITKNITLYAKWEANKYTVKFNANGGQGTMADQQFTYDQEATLNANSFTREGYTFAGWSETANETVKYVNGAKVKNLAEGGNKALYAVWKQNRKYTITFNANNGTDAKAEQVIDFNKEVKLNKNTFKEEFTITYNYNNTDKKIETEKVNSKFLGWSTEKDGEVKYKDEANIKAVDNSKEDSINLYAKWEKPTITLRKVDNTTNTKFLGWSTSDKKENIISENTTYTVVGNITLTAIWEKIVPQEAPKIESISFVVKDEQGQTHREEAIVGDEVFFVKFPEEYEIDLASIMIKTNTPVRLNDKAVSSKGYVDITSEVYDKEGRSGCLKLMGFSALLVNSKDGITWESTDSELYITLDMLNTLLDNQNLGVAKGFAKTDDGQETPHYISNMEQFQTGDTYLYFYKEDAKKVKIELKNGENNSYTTTIPQGGVLPENIGKVEKDFEGWYTDANYTKKFDFSKPVNNDTILYAKYKEPEKEIYTVTYDSKGGTAVAEQKITSGEKTTAPTAPTRKGYTFNGWYSDAEYKTTFNFNTAITKNITLYAKWEANKYTVKFDANGGQGKMEDQQFAYDQEGNLNNNTFTRTGYTFAGWGETKEAQTAKYANGEKVKNLAESGNKTLYAVWTQNQNYTVKFDSKGGTSVTEQKVASGAKATTPTAPTRKGYTFKGWYKDNNYKEEFKFDTPVTQNLTLYAKWEANKYAIKFDSNGGTGTMNDQQFTYDQEGNLNNNSFTREGYTFAGWSDTASGTVKYENKAKVKNLAESGSKTLYAVWTQNRKYTIIFNANNGTNTTTQQVIDYDKEVILNKNTFKEEFTVTYKNDKDNQQNNKTEKISSTFLGWSIVKDGDVKYKDQAKVKAVDMNNDNSITLYAKWQKPTIKIEKLSDTEQYKFLGWSKTANKNDLISENTDYTVVGNVTLTAMWEEIKQPDNPPTPVEPRIVDISFEIKDKNGTVKRQNAVVCADDVFYVCLPEGCSVNVASINLKTNTPIQLNANAKTTKRTDIALKNCSEDGRTGSLSVMDMDVMTIQSEDGMLWVSSDSEESYFDLSLLKLALSMKPGASIGIVEGFGITDNGKNTPRYDSAIKTDHAGNVYLYFYKTGTETVKVTWVNNGEKIENTIPKGGKLPKRIGVEETGFDEWYSDDKYTKKFDFEKPITEDTVLYAKYNNSKKASAVAYAGVKMIGLFNQ